MQGLFGLTTSKDPTFNIGFVTSAIETNLALVTASAPALRPIFRSRERGGWFGRFSVAPSKGGPDIETGEKPVGWLSDSTMTPPTPSKGTISKFGRGGNRGGRRGGRSGRGRGGAKKYDIRIRRSNSDAAQLRSQSPRSSEEETMTSNGIMRVSDIQREIDGIVKEISVSGAGTYTGVTPPQPSGNGNYNNNYNNKNTKSARSLTKNNNTYKGDDVNVNNFRDTTFDFFTTRAGDERQPRRENPERYYSESIYPDIDFAGGESRDYNDERISKYGEKRFGVVTPKGTTPTSRGWRDEGGRPF